MKIKIEIKNGQVALFLEREKNVLGKLVFPEERNLAEKLLPNIDKLLKKNMIGPGDISEMELEADMDDSYTTFRIAKAVVDSFNWAKSFGSVDNSRISSLSKDDIEKKWKTIKRLK